MARAMNIGGRSESELLTIVKGERDRSIGFDRDPELLHARTEALDYYKGVMPDMKTRPNRSVAVSTDVADTIETILPELMDIFVGGDDVVSFDATRADDVDAAQQETDYLHQVIFSRNNGFLTIHAFIKDALLSKTGLVQWYWADSDKDETETFEGKTAIEVGMAAQDGELINLTYKGQPVTAATKLPPEAVNDPEFAFEMAKEGPDGSARIEPIAPEDFTVARDTVWLSEATYCAVRSRPRAQELKAQGHDAAKIDDLPAYGIDRDERVKQARDTAGEHLLPDGNNAGPDHDLRTVEVLKHHIRLLDAGKLALFSVVTDAECAVVLNAEKVDRIKIAAITPRIITHRFYGQSIADIMAEIQRIKTSVLRMALDHGYFALNQRTEVDMSKANEFTLADLLDNRPGRPVRVKEGGAVTSLNSAGQPYDFFGALEYLSTMGESRSGVIRNAQGLNPDTLHDTATGAVQMLNESQKKIRFIARVIAETGLKDLMLGVHALIREHATQPVETQLRGKWITVDPTNWGERNDMTVELGVGAGGRMQKVAALEKIIADQMAVVALPSGPQYVTPANMFRARIDAARALGLKAPDSYYTDPATAQPPPPAPPNPELLKLQAQMQDGQAERAQALQIEQGKGEMEQRKLLAAHVENLAKIAADERIEKAKLQFANQKLGADVSTKVRDTDTRAHTAIEVAEIGAHTAAQGHMTDLMVQDKESADVRTQAAADRRHDLGKTALGHLADIHAATGDRTHAIASQALGHLADHDAAQRDKAHDVGMAGMQHRMGEAAADAAAERAPDPPSAAGDADE